jgi:hypothetical protein
VGDIVANASDNLIPGGHKLTLEEQSAGGKASGEARRKKATMISVLEKMLDDVPTKDNEGGLTNRELATLGLIKGARQGYSKNYEIIQDLMKKKEEKDDEKNIFVELPAKDTASQFVDVYRAIMDRDYREFYL